MRILKAFENAQKEGKGVFSLDGRDGRQTNYRTRQKDN